VHTAHATHAEHSLDPVPGEVGTGPECVHGGTVTHRIWVFNRWRLPPHPLRTRVRSPADGPADQALPPLIGGRHGPNRIPHGGGQSLACRSALSSMPVPLRCTTSTAPV